MTHGCVTHFTVSSLLSRSVTLDLTENNKYVDSLPVLLTLSFFLPTFPSYY
jgi:hypothetical protein